MTQLMKDLDRAVSRLKRRYAGAAVLLLVAFLGVAVIWNRSIKEELAEQAILFIRKSLQSGDTRGVIQSLNGVRLEAFNSITHYDQMGRRVVTLPPTVAPVEYRDQSFWDHVFLGEVKSTIRLDDDRQTELGSVTFTYSRFELAGYAFIAWLFVVACIAFPLSNTKKRLGEELERELALQNSRNLKDLVGKVRHNIRSPVAVLSAYFTSPATESLNLKFQGHRAVHRIEEILAEMEEGKEEHRQENAVPSQALSDCVELAREIIEEKAHIFSSRRLSIKSNEEFIYSSVPASDLRSTFSNLLDNALEATNDLGAVEMRIEADGHLVAISIQDNGKGIPENIKAKVRQKGFTFGKPQGSGLGLFYADRLMEEHSGNLMIESEPGIGTTVILLFPQQPNPSWHCGGIVVPPGGKLHILDDQDYVLQAWRLKIPLEQHGRLIFHSKTEALEPFTDPVPQDRFLFDFDFGPGKRSGLDAIQALQIAPSVSPRYWYGRPTRRSASLRQRRLWAPSERKDLERCSDLFVGTFCLLLAVRNLVRSIFTERALSSQFLWPTANCRSDSRMTTPFGLLF